MRRKYSKNKLNSFKFFFTFLLGIFTLISINTEAKMTENWDKVFKKSDKVNVEKIHFKNRYGIELTGDLYTPKINNRFIIP